VSAPVVSAEGLHTYYGPSHVLHGVDLEVRRGETVALMGRNGMGKTTLLRSLMGLTPPTRGRVMIDGRDMTGAPTHAVARAGLALVPEGRGMFPSLSVREHLVMAARPGRDGRAQWTLARVLETFPRLAERLDLGGARLSGGEQQMLTIGRALMTNPELLILDEATEGLAPLIAREIWAMLRRIRDGGMAAIIVDKNHAAVTAIANRCVILVKGHVAFAGTAAELRARPDILQRHLGV
jgi:branched-chain amino acid transport system ATP-binding protein